MMDRSDIAALATEVFEEFVAHPPIESQDYSIRMTSGTTSGSPFLTIWQNKNGAEWRLKTMRRFIVAFGPRAMRTGNVLFFRNSEEEEGLILPLDAGSLEPGVERLLNDFAPDSFYAFPSFAARVAEHMSDSARENVHTLGFSGEAVSKTLGAFFSSRFVRARQVVTFGTAETGVITKYPCKHLAPNQYHPRDGVDIDVFEPDESGVGFLLISKDLLFGRRMERYKIGDMARIVPDQCPCGEALTFEVFGRAGYDFIKVAGAILRREEFDRAAQLCEELFDDYRAEAEEIFIDGKLKGKIVLTVYRAHGISSVDAIAQAFSSCVFLTPSQTLLQLVSKELFLPLEVVVSTGSMPQAAGKSMKLSLRNR